MKKDGDNRNCGFTLLETLVALAVVAIAMAALWKGLSQGQYLSEGLPDRVMARWVAQNRITIKQVTGEWPDTRTYNGTELMGGKEFFWQEQISTTNESTMRRITVSVGNSPDSNLFSLDGYLHRPVPSVPYERLLSR